MLIQFSWLSFISFICRSRTHWIDMKCDVWPSHGPAFTWHPSILRTRVHRIHIELLTHLTTYSLIILHTASTEIISLTFIQVFVKRWCCFVKNTHSIYIYVEIYGTWRLFNGQCRGVLGIWIHRARGFTSTTIALYECTRAHLFISRRLHTRCLRCAWCVVHLAQLS